MAWTRREFVKASALAIPASVGPAVVGAQQGSAPAAPATPPPAPAVFTPLRRNVGIFHQRGGTIGWLVNRDGLLVVDSQFADTAPNLLSGLKERSPRAIDVLINTHHHPDHTGGNGVLRPAAKQIVAHERSKQNQVAQAERMKSSSHASGRDLHRHVERHARRRDDPGAALGTGAHRRRCLLHFEQANVVHLGDLLNNRGYPNVDAPAGASVHGWIRVLEQMAPAYPADALYVYGHAEAGHPFIGTRADLLYQRDYFTAVIDYARTRAQGRPRPRGAGEGGGAAALRALRGHEGAPRTGADHGV